MASPVNGDIVVLPQEKNFEVSSIRHVQDRVHTHMFQDRIGHLCLKVTYPATYALAFLDTKQNGLPIEFINNVVLPQQI